MEINPILLSKYLKKELTKFESQTPVDGGSRYSFRKEMMENYEKKCMVTGSNDAVEAAHIYPRSIEAYDCYENGLWLRADWHKVLDEGKWTFEIASNPKGEKYYRVQLGPTLLRNESFKYFNGETIGYDDEHAVELYKLVNKYVDLRNSLPEYKSLI